MRVSLVASTPNPEEVITIAASTCYSTRDLNQMKEFAKDPDNQEHMIKNLIDNNHDSPLEHVSFSFYIENTDRVTTHQLVRHRLASVSQRSQRYTFQSKEAYNTPEAILENKDMKQEFDNTIKSCFELYDKLISLGIKKEDARYILPNASQSTLMVTMNLRELRHFLNLRMCLRAEEGIVEVANEMYNLVYDSHPLLLYKAGPNCWLGCCKETKLTSKCPRRHRW